MGNATKHKLQPMLQKEAGCCVGARRALCVVQPCAVCSDAGSVQKYVFNTPMMVSNIQ